MTKQITPCRPKWKGTMTDRERFNAQMHYKPVDRCFNMEFGYWQENYDQWPLFLDNDIRTEEEANVFFNFDRIEFIAPWKEIWFNPAFEYKVISENETTQFVQNGDGLIGEVFKSGLASIPHFTKSSIETPDDWKRVKEERWRLDDPARKVDIEALKKQHPADRDYPLGIYCGSMIGRIRDILTVEGLAYATYDYPEMIEDMIETNCQMIEQAIDQILPHFQFDYAAGWEDICYKSGPLVTVEFFRDLVVPRYKRIHAKLKAAGIDIWYTDCDGDVRPIMPLLLESGINCLFPFEVQCCAHPSELLNEYGKDLRIMGGFNKLEMIKGKAEIKKYMESLVPLVERGGYIPFCDHRCPPDVTPENYLYYLDLKEQMFGLK